jgi:hypothetical protein
VLSPVLALPKPAIFPPSRLVVWNQASREKVFGPRTGVCVASIPELVPLNS